MMTSSADRSIPSDFMADPRVESENFARQIVETMGERVRIPYASLSLAKRGKLPRGSVAPLY
jgi:hypothetical protein